MQPFSMRPALPADAPALRTLLDAPGDYLHRVLDVWLGSPVGTVLMAQEGDTPLGMLRWSLVTPGEAWIQGIRVAPERRGQGVGMRLLLRSLADAQAAGAEVARASTAEDNAAAQHMFAQAGFTHIGGYSLFTGPTADATPDTYPGAVISQGDVTMLDDLWAWLERSQIAPLNGGLLMNGTLGQALTDSVLLDALATGEVWLLRAWDELQALMLARPERRHSPTEVFTIRYLDGAAEGVSRLALYLRHIAAERGFAEIAARPPELLILHDALNGAGLTRAELTPQWVYVKELGADE